MKLISTYSVKIKHYNHIFEETVIMYRKAVDFFLDVVLREWTGISELTDQKQRVNAVERMTHRTAKNPIVSYDFAVDFYKFPSYLRRAAIADALGMASSYHSNLENWKEAGKEGRGKAPSLPKAGLSFPTLYKGNMYKRDDVYEAQIKIYIRNTWDYLPICLRKTDVDYITKHCGERKECNPTLRKKGSEWFLDFPFKEEIALNKTKIKEQTIVAVDLGLNHAATCCVMKADGTVLGRHFCDLPREKDSLVHALNRSKKAQQHGARHMARLWARVNGINGDLARKTVRYIMGIALEYHADGIIFEHLELQGKKRGSKKQMLHLWKARAVQKGVEHQAHRCGMRVSHVNAWNTSKYAFDGSGRVKRGTYDQNGKESYNYSICTFRSGKQYNCDLNATYNIGARYFIREILKSLSETIRLGILAKVPECAKRSTCTLSSLIHLNVVLASTSSK